MTPEAEALILEDARRMLGALARAGFRERGDEASVERLRTDAWTATPSGLDILLCWSDGMPIGVFARSDVEIAVAVLRLRRGEVPAEPVN